jgi:hypothetical protein
MPTAMLVALIALATVALDPVRLRQDARYERFEQVQPLSPAPAPQPPQAPGERPKSDIAVPKGEDAITISGCVHGSHFKPSRESVNDVPTALLKVSEYVLDGKRELLQRLKTDHDGHYEEVTGVAKIPPDFQHPQTQVRSKDVGKTRITIGTRQETAYLPSPDKPVRIIVDSFRHINDHCAVR